MYLFLFWRINNLIPYKDKEYHKKYYIKNKYEMLERQKQYRKNNPESVRKYGEKWREKNSDYSKEYYKNNREKILIKQKEWHKNNRRKKGEYNKQYCRNNRKKLNNYGKKRYQTNLKVNLNERMATAINISLKGKKAGRHWEDLVGYKLKDLIKRLKSTIPEGYSWQSFMDGKLHIDHIVPISAFNFDKPEHIDFKLCWNLSNLRLLPAKENIIKRNKLYKPFQPALEL